MDIQQYLGQIIASDKNGVPGAIGSAIDMDNQSALKTVVNNPLSGYVSISTSTTITDTSKNFEVNLLANKTLKTRISDKDYYRKITSNTADTITITTLGDAVKATINLTGSGGASITLSFDVEGAIGNNRTVTIVDGTGISSPLTAVHEGDNLIITSATDESGVARGIMASELATLISTDPTLSLYYDVEAGTVEGQLDLILYPLPFSGGVDAVTAIPFVKYEII